MRLASGVFGRYYESGNKSIQLHFTFRGVRCREKITGSDPDSRNHVKYAINTLAAIKREIGNNTFSYPDFFPDSARARLFGHAASNRMVKEIGESWLADMKRSLPHSTYNSYEGPCKRFVYPAIGDLRIRDVTVEHIRRMFRDADISLKTARNYSTPLRAIFDRALDDDYIDRNPMDRIKVRTLIPAERHKTDYKIDPLNQQEIDAVLEACRKFRPGWINYFTLAFYTGLRTSELYGLHWSDLDLKAGCLSVERAVVEGKVKSPKTQSSIRSVELNAKATSALKRQRALTELIGVDVFRNPNTSQRLLEYEVSNRAFKFCQLKAGIRQRNQYQTRHTYASNLLSEGVNPLFVAQQLGHRDVQMVFRVYGRWIGEQVSSDVEFGR